MTTQDRLTDLQAQGFDASYVYGLDVLGRSRPTMIRVQCSRCKVALINGVPAHETGCLQARHECRGCTAVIPVHQKHCEDCQ